MREDSANNVTYFILGQSQSLIIFKDSTLNSDSMTLDCIKYYEWQESLFAAAVYIDETITKYSVALTDSISTSVILTLSILDEGTFT